MNTELRPFVRESLARGLSREAIRQQLAGAGWRADEIEAALGEWAESDFPVPVPRRRAYTSAQEAFLYLVLFATLYTTAYSTGAILFALIEKWLPDPAWRAYDQGWRVNVVRDAAASLIIAFPVYLWVSRLIGAAIDRDPEKRGSRVRKWLTYLTLFVAACVMIGDLIFLVGRLLGGELAPRVLLKSTVVFLIAGVVFGHYLGDLRREESDGAAPARRRASPLARAAAVVVALVLVAGLVVIGSPARERVRQIDAQRVDDLRALSSAVENYTVSERRLPANLDEVLRSPTGFGASPDRMADPVTRLPYEYRTLDSLSYELCATFDAADSMAGVEYGQRPRDAGPFWRHPAGRHCYRLEIPRNRWERAIP